MITHSFSKKVLRGPDGQQKRNFFCQRWKIKKNIPQLHISFESINTEYFIKSCSIFPSYEHVMDTLSLKLNLTIYIKHVIHQLFTRKLLPHWWLLIFILRLTNTHTAWGPKCLLLAHGENQHNLAFSRFPGTPLALLNYWVLHHVVSLQG